MPGGRVERHIDDSPFAFGTHKGADNATVLNDPGKDFWSCGVQVGSLIKNITDGSEGLITAVTEDAVTCDALTGGSDTEVVQDTGDYTLGGANVEDGTPDRAVVTSSTKFTLTNLDNDEEVWAYKDFGAGYFDGDFEIHLKVNGSVATGAPKGGLCALTNTVDCLYDIRLNATEDFLALCWNWVVFHFFILRENVAFTNQASQTSISTATDYYVNIVMDRNVGTYGTLYSYIYTGSIGGTLIGTPSLTLTKKHNPRYLFWLIGWDSAADTGNAWTGTIENLKIITDFGNMWQAGDEYEIYITDTENSKISSTWTDKRYGRKYDKQKLIRGLIPGDEDLDEDGQDIFGPGQPERSHK